MPRSQSTTGWIDMHLDVMSAARFSNAHVLAMLLGEGMFLGIRPAMAAHCLDVRVSCCCAADHTPFAFEVPDARRPLMKRRAR